VTAVTQQATGGRRGPPYLAAFVAVVTMMLGTATASAATSSRPETRVGAHASSVQVLVGASDTITAGPRLGNYAAGPGIVVATGVAAETAALTEREIGTAVDDVLAGASFYKQSQATQYLKPGGFGQANADSDAPDFGPTEDVWTPSTGELIGSLIHDY
jgi:hypothetical protein